jgi:thiamine biosynthesis protein ThiS
MKLSVNGNQVELAGESASVKDLLASQRYTFPLIVVKVNGAVVPREDYASSYVRDGDSVDAYHLVSGG